MAKDWAKPFYNSKSWQRASKTFIAMRQSIDGGMCQRCKVEPGYIVHHIKHLTKSNINDPEISLNQENLEYLCQTCHNQEHIANKSTKKNLYFDEFGRLKKI